jgi:hypothetical protein
MKEISPDFDELTASARCRLLRTPTLSALVRRCMAGSAEFSFVEQSMRGLFIAPGQRDNEPPCPSEAAALELVRTAGILSLADLRAALIHPYR